MADPIGSTMGGGEHADYNIEGIGNDFIPKTMDMSLVDQVIKVSDTDAFEMTREITRRAGVIAGTSSGSSLWCALQLAEKIDSGNIVVLFPTAATAIFPKRFTERPIEPSCMTAGNFGSPVYFIYSGAF